MLLECWYCPVSIGRGGDTAYANERRLRSADDLLAEASDQGALGTGVTPFAALFDRLATAGWDGWICLEEASQHGRAGVEAAIHFVRRSWQDSLQRAG